MWDPCSTCMPASEPTPESLLEWDPCSTSPNEHSFCTYWYSQVIRNRACNIGIGEDLRQLSNVLRGSTDSCSFTNNIISNTRASNTNMIIGTQVTIIPRIVVVCSLTLMYQQTTNIIESTISFAWSDLMLLLLANVHTNQIPERYCSALCLS